MFNYTKSLKLTTWNIAEYPCKVTLYTPNKRWIKYKLSKSLECKWRLKTILTVQPKIYLGFLLILIVKEASTLEICNKIRVKIIYMSSIFCFIYVYYFR